MQAAEPLGGGTFKLKITQMLQCYVNITKVKLQGVKIHQNIFKKNLLIVLKRHKKT